MKKLALLGLTAIALMFAPGANVGAASGMSSPHGPSGFHHGHGVTEHHGFDRSRFVHQDFDGHHHFHRHVGVIIGVPIWWPPECGHVI